MSNRLIIGEGPGSVPEPDKVRVDIIEAWADIKLDVSKRKLPFPDDHFDYVEAHHIAEHIGPSKDFLHFMKEIHRVLKVGGTVDITVPHKDCNSAYECYEHVRFFVENSFVNFYNNPYAKEMGIPQFKCLVAEKRPHGTAVEVHVILEK